MADEDGRLIRCTGPCGETIRVYELPGEFIDPGRYVCLECKVLAEEPTQPALFGEHPPGWREETRDYDPLIAAIPF